MTDRQIKDLVEALNADLVKVKNQDSQSRAARSLAIGIMIGVLKQLAIGRTASLNIKGVLESLESHFKNYLQTDDEKQFSFALAEASKLSEPTCFNLK